MSTASETLTLEQLAGLSVEQINELNPNLIPEYSLEDLNNMDFSAEAISAIKGKKDPKRPTQGGDIGDPGILLNIAFNNASAPEKVHWVNVDVLIDIPEKQNTRSLGGTQISQERFQHHVSFTMDANNGDKNNPIRHNELDLSEPYQILIPFVDVNWFEKKHHEIDIKYRLEFKYNEVDEVVHVEDGIVIASAVHEGPFAIETDKSNLPSYMPWVQKIGDLHFDEVIYTEHGVWWKMHYVDNQPRPTYLFGEHGSNSNFCPRPSAHGNYRVDEYESCFLPYPRLKNSSYPREKCRLMVGNHPNSINFNPPEAFETKKGGWKIVGTSLTGANHAAIHTRSVPSLPLADPHKAPKTYGATENTSAPASDTRTNSSSTESSTNEPSGAFQDLIDWIKGLFN
ncbi:MAG: hypothetical protein AB8H47_07605 [Bacteroidia bacterium]